MSSTERNKVKSFGDPSIAHGEMADRFLIVGAFNAPPVTNRVKKPCFISCKGLTCQFFWTQCKVIGTSVLTKQI